MMSTALLFMGIALFFTFISYVPRFKIEGPETFSRFADAGQAISLIIILVGLLFFLKNWRTGWPWIITSLFFSTERALAGIPRQHRPHQVADRTRRVDWSSACLRSELADFRGLALGGMESRSSQTDEATCGRGSNTRLSGQGRYFTLSDAGAGRRRAPTPGTVRRGERQRLRHRDQHRDVDAAGGLLPAL